MSDKTEPKEDTRGWVRRRNTGNDNDDDHEMSSIRIMRTEDSGILSKALPTDFPSILVKPTTASFLMKRQPSPEYHEEKNNGFVSPDFLYIRAFFPPTRNRTPTFPRFSSFLLFSNRSAKQVVALLITRYRVSNGSECSSGIELPGRANAIERKFLHEHVYSSLNRFHNAAVVSPVVSSHHFIVRASLDYNGEREGDEVEERGNGKSKGSRKGRQPLAKLVYSSSRSSMFAYGDGSNRYSMNSKNLLLVEGTPIPFPSLPGSPFVRRDEKAHPIPDDAGDAQKGTDNKCLQHASQLSWKLKCRYRYTRIS